MNLIKKLEELDSEYFNAYVGKDKDAEYYMNLGRCDAIGSVIELVKNDLLHNVTNRFLATAHYPSMEHKIHDVIEIPSEEWKHADGTYCDSQYFLDYPDYFKEI